MKFTIKSQTQVERITGRNAFARPQRPHSKKGEYKRKEKFGAKWD